TARRSSCRGRAWERRRPRRYETEEERTAENAGEERERRSEGPRDDLRVGDALGSAGVLVGMKQKKSAPQRTQGKNETGDRRDRETIFVSGTRLGAPASSSVSVPKRETGTGTEAESGTGTEAEAEAE